GTVDVAGNERFGTGVVVERQRDAQAGERERAADGHREHLTPGALAVRVTGVAVEVVLEGGLAELAAGHDADAQQSIKAGGSREGDRPGASPSLGDGTVRASDGRVDSHKSDRATLREDVGRELDSGPLAVQVTQTRYVGEQGERLQWPGTRDADHDRHHRRGLRQVQTAISDGLDCSRQSHQATSFLRLRALNPANLWR